MNDVPDFGTITIEALVVAESAVDQIRAAGVEVVETGPFLHESIDVFLLIFYGAMVPKYRQMMETSAFDDATPRLQKLIRGAADRLTVGSLESAWAGNTYPFNVTRRSAGTTWAGFAADAMPVGLQTVGHQLADRRTVELAAWTEDLLNLNPIAPKVRRVGSDPRPT